MSDQVQQTITLCCTLLCTSFFSLFPRARLECFEGTNEGTISWNDRTDHYLENQRFPRMFLMASSGYEQNDMNFQSTYHDVFSDRTV